MQSKKTISLAEKIARLSPDQKALLRAKLKNNDSNIKPLLPQSRNKIIPLSFAQQGFWLFEQLEQGQTVNNEWTACRIDGSLNIENLKYSIHTIIERHEILRTQFVIKDEQPVQIIKSNFNIDLDVESLQYLSEEKRWAEMKKLSILETQRPFDLSEAPLLRIRIFKINQYTHVLLLVFHHIVTDAWSAAIFYEELGRTYTTLSHQHPALPDELPVQYADYSIWEQEQPYSQILKKQLTYWKKQLTNLSPLELPIDYPRPGKQRFQGAEQSIILPSAALTSLRVLSQHENCSIFMALLAVFQILLYRYSGQSDIAVGSPVTNRKQPVTRKLIGCFINTLIFRSTLLPDLSFRILLQKVRDMVLDALNHQDVPFEKLVEALQPERDLSRNPLFQVMFVYNDTMSSIDHFGTLNTSLVRIESTVSAFDLSLHVTEHDNNLKAYFRYNTGLFKEASIQRMAEHFALLIAAITDAPDKIISQIPLLTYVETQQLKKWNNTTADYPENKTIVDLFEQQVKKTPDDIALAFEEHSLTYHQLNQQANQLANYLLSIKVEDGGYLLASLNNPVIAIAIERSLEMVIGLLAVMKAGGAYLPLDPDYPVERLAFMLNDSNSSLLLTQSKFCQITDQLIANNNIDRVYIDSYCSNDVCDDLDVNINSDTLAYVIYTSGSTGKPKGVKIGHRSVVNLLTSMHNLTGISPQDSLLSISSVSFDIMGLEVYLPLICGAKVVIANKEIIKDGLSLAKKLNDNSVTMIQGTPATWRLLQLANWVGNNKVTILSGGESLPIDLALYLKSRSRNVWNFYGPTETTIWSTAYFLKEISGSNPIPVGYPVMNTRVHILDRYMQPVPVGVHGELYISGDGLAHGYINQPELTAEKFRVHSFDDEDPIRIYKTGDLACYLPDGNIEILGRIDKQTKLRGFRIELDEVDAILLQHPDIQEAATIIKGQSDIDKKIVSYIVTKNKEKVFIDGLRQYLKQKLPDYMLPSAFVALPALPLTPNAKVDLDALPDSEEFRKLSQEVTSAPKGKIECTLARLWQQVLNIPSVGRDDNFFDLGGHSLLFLKLSNLIKKEQDVFLPDNVLLQGYSIKDQAIYISSLSYLSLAEKNINYLALSDSDRSKILTLANGKNQQQHSDYPLIFPYNEGLSGIPLYFVSGSKYLASHIKNRPYYELLSGFNLIKLDQSNINVLADYYARAIIDMNPSGPYILGGYCSGGLLAFEIARRILADNRIVPLLILVDQSLPYPYSGKIAFLPFYNNRSLAADLSHPDTEELAEKYYPEGWTVDAIDCDHMEELSYTSSILISERIEARIQQAVDNKKILPLPESAKRYEIESELKSHDFNNLLFNISVTNNSEEIWPAKQVCITDLWLSSSGKIIEFKRNKLIIDHDISPGEKYSFLYSANKVRESGEFTLYLFLSDLFGTDFNYQYGQKFKLGITSYDSPPIDIESIDKMAEAGELNTAIQHYKHYLHDNSADRVKVLIKIANIIGQARGPQCSVDISKLALQANPDEKEKANIYQTLYEEYYSLKDYANSEFYLNKFLKTNSTLKSALYLALIYTEQKKYSEANKIFLSQIKKHKDHYPNVLSKALMIFAENVIRNNVDGRYLSSIFKNKPSINNNQVQFLFNYAQFKINENKLEDAEVILEELIDYYPFLLPAYEMLYSINIGVNQIDKAIKIKEKMCRLSPFSITHKRELAELKENKKLKNYD
ncbi:non-ribosomal peptide synthetase [Oceanospirillum sediminis]|uniref:Amino acid adenylation domain-containing protein n=1 Tax=Oceanospirillum sediminis TaxID=2760088 RepID=A0A839IV70_9GAMM|nr:non-ribosomal peptide synthetase [Oceanospirillum sediminis]MBB1488602.1 amino acid adenylation domain-containing protein [Oceanospirillum sediminis]